MREIGKRSQQRKNRHCLRFNAIIFLYVAAKVEGAGDVGTQAREKGSKGGGRGARGRDEQP